MANQHFLDKTGLALVWAQIKLALQGKVDKVDGKGLSTNDYTDAEKLKLNGIQAGAEVNVNPDWTAETGDGVILHKPTIPSATSQLTNDSGFITSADVPEGAAASTTTPLMDGTAATGSETTFARGDHVHPSDTTKVDKVEGKGLSTNDYTTAEKNKLAAIAAGAEVNVNADWNAVSGDAQILNKPTIPTASSTTPAMDGTAAVGTDTGFARGDHVHPSDSTKVDKVTGKGLSTNDFTTALKTKLEGIAEGAEVNVNADWNASSGDAQILNKPTIPTNNNQLTNGAGYQTASDVNTLIASAIGDLEGVDFEIVQNLPVTGDKSKIYLVPLTTSGTNNGYDEYIWLTSSTSYEKIGTTDIDLTDYYNTTNLVAITSAEISEICV